MFRPSLSLSLLTAMLGADAVQTPASSSRPVNAAPSTQVVVDELSESKKIIAEARQALGNQLRNL